MAIFNCFSIPFTLAFQPDFANTNGWNLTNWAITVTFAIDLAVNIRTTYIDEKEGEEIFNSRLMALHYLFSFRFWVDLFSTLPFDTMFQSVMSPSANQLLSLLGMLKLFRASRISTVIARLKF